MEIYTNAPNALDYKGTQHIEQLGTLRVVSVGGTQKMAEVQLLRYRDRGFFATTYRVDAVAYVSQNETIERPSDPDQLRNWRRERATDMDETLPL